MRADSLQVEDPATLPFFRDLAAQSTVFTKAYSNSSWTSPSVASLFTSRYASQHHVTTFRSQLAGDEVRLAEVLKESGYRTAAFTSSLLAASRAFQRGFDFIEYIVPPEGEAKARAPLLQEQLSIWLSAPTTEATRPLFLYLHYLESHIPYEAPLSSLDVVRRSRARQPAAAATDPRLRGTGPDGKDEDIRDLYAAEIVDLDRSLSDLFGILKQQGVLDNAVVVFLADHGEEFLEHDVVGHGYTLYDKAIHIPLLIHVPGQVTSTSEPRPVSLVDVAPTLLELAGIPIPAQFEGESLQGYLGGAGWPSPRMALDRTLASLPWSAVPQAYSELFPQSADAAAAEKLPLRARMEPRYKAMSGDDGSVRVFDLEQDPMEQTALPPDQYPVAERLRLFAPRVSATDKAVTEPQLDEKTRERLRALGYTDN